MSGREETMYTLREEDEEADELLVHKCQELFALCDGERKGFISKKDLHSLGGDQLPLTKEQLDEVFDTLDEDGSGALTLEEFRSGFASFLGINKDPQNKEIHYEETVNDDQFYQLLESLGATDLFGNEQDMIMGMWKKLKCEEDQNVMLHFENFLGHVTAELRRSQSEYSDLETLFKNRSNVHDKELRRLLEEMEQAVEAERVKIHGEEILKERKIREDLQNELREKNRFLQELLQKQADMERKLRNIYSTETETKQENSILMQERDVLEQRLAYSEKTLKDLKDNLESLRILDIKEKRERMKSTLKVSEGIAIEREGLVKQLNILRNVNKQLLDEQDAVILAGHDIRNECENSRPVSSPYSDELSSPVIEPGLDKQGQENTNGTSNPFLKKEGLKYDYEVDDSYFRSGSISSQSYLPDDKSEYSYISFSSSDVSKEGKTDNSLKKESSNYKGVNPFLTGSSEFHHIPLDNRKAEWKVKRSWSRELDHETQVSDVSSNPDRIYKVVFIGDSGVGKSSFIHRFCHNDFRSTFSATIGVDFQVKSVNVEGHFVALQLWDTAGQERFRSVTKQYYRKADGVIIMFDVTSETSFKNVLTWINDVKEGSDDSTVLMLVGNKTDLCRREEARVVKGRDGERLAQDYGALFFETSAKLAEGVDDSMLAMAVLLQRREDETIERTLRLQETSKKSKCCKN